MSHQHGYTYFGSKRKLTKKGQPINDVVFPALDEEYAERHRGNHFYIRYCGKTGSYKIKDLGIGFGVFMRRDDEVVLRNNTLVNVGLEYLTVNTAYGTGGNFQQNPEFQKLESEGRYFFGSLGFEAMKKERFVETVHTCGRRELAFLKLQFFGGKADEEVYYFCTSLQGTITLGRARENLISFDDSMLSKKQCEVFFLPQKGWVLRDCNSTNGVWLYADEECRLDHGCVFKANQNMFAAHLTP